ncbi:MAG: TrkH family potassium uptake protein [Candidatus Borkfalkiaceae bacterium]|nr:TrkH family potassium uptake protein [Christensenellaceae bacterium]
MNYRFIFNLIGKVLKAEGLLLLLPTLVSALYWEKAFFYLGGSAVVIFLIGTLLTCLCRHHSGYFFAKEGFISVALTWVAISVFGALPFTISGEIPNYIDALFEMVSGFTTTGASIVPNVEKLSNGMNMWRCFSHWVGGMGIIVFVIALSDRVPDQSMYVLRAEMPGPIVGKLVPRAKQTSAILYIIYIAMTVIMFVFLLCGGEMDLFEAACHSFGTAGTGGFGIKADSLAGYGAYSQWVIAVFMMLFGINFNLYYLILVGKIKSFFKSSEMWTYVSIIVCSTALISWNTLSMCANFSEAVRNAFVQVTSIITTTGFSSLNYDLWPTLSKAILFILMFIGGCAGSTAGGFKVSRLVIVFKKIVNDLKQMLHPRTKTALMFECKRLDDQTVNGVCSYSIVYFLLIGIMLLLLCLDPATANMNGALESNLSAVVSCFNNVGPAFGFAGPSSSYANYSIFSKIILTLAMLLGRLEIYPMLLFLTPTTWLKK